MNADALAERLRHDHPDAEPFELDPAVLAIWISSAGADPEDDRLVSATLVAWERLLA